ncbi:hypothetical protein RHMOL_Rhmol09G0230800 [Rhododendron molle]|uniref:Uncharacterized protein n=1 Tax=Rhododendron molle TaxID=49168 RepID=A0ACC0MGM5_RHOML|nr:hypothetical protein RHMOL_Rhmol09G0230800 [Rhododendron molle]
MDSTVEKLPPNVLLFPFPAHSHIHFLLNLAELLCCRGGLHLTFLVADQTHRHLLNDTAVRSRFDRYSGFQFQNLRDGLPVRDSQGSLDKTMEFGSSFLEVAKPRFKDVLISLSSSDWQKAEEDYSDHVTRKSSIACIIVDSMMASFAADVAGEAGDDLDVPIANVPGLEGLLRRRDLSSFLRAGDLSDKNAQFIINGVSQARRARMILNTFEELERPALAQMRSLCPGSSSTFERNFTSFNDFLKTEISPESTSTNRTEINKLNPLFRCEIAGETPNPIGYDTRHQPPMFRPQAIGGHHHLLKQRRRHVLYRRHDVHAPLADAWVVVGESVGYGLERNPGYWENHQWVSVWRRRRR